MKRQFYLHRENAPLSASSVIYHVWAGESVRDQRALAQLIAWAFQNSATLQSWGEDIDFYVQIESERIFSGAGILDFGFVRADLSVHEALRIAREDSWVKFESSLSQPKEFFRALSLNDPSRIDHHSAKIVPSYCLANPRKNLSERVEDGRFIISFI